MTVAVPCAITNETASAIESAQPKTSENSSKSRREPPTLIRYVIVYSNATAAKRRKDFCARNVHARFNKYAVSVPKIKPTVRAHNGAKASRPICRIHVNEKSTIAATMPVSKNFSDCVRSFFESSTDDERSACTAENLGMKLTRLSGQTICQQRQNQQRQTTTAQILPNRQHRHRATQPDTHPTDPPAPPPPHIAPTRRANLHTTGVA